MEGGRDDDGDAQGNGQDQDGHAQDDQVGPVKRRARGTRGTVAVSNARDKPKFKYVYPCIQCKDVWLI